MTEFEITSLQNPIVKYFVKLRNSRAYRKEQNTALIVGTKLVQELASHTPLITLLVENGAELPPVNASQIYYVTPEILKKITGLEQPEPYAAEVALPKPADLSGKKYLLALDGISDPGNLGTLLRTALALGWEGVFISEGSADPFNEKALRAAKGATFHLPLCEGNFDELNQLIEKNKLSVYIADMNGQKVDTEKLKVPLILVLGSEAHGVQFKPKTAAHTLSIPIHAKMESLNVAVAGGILMYLMREAP